MKSQPPGDRSRSAFHLLLATRHCLRNDDQIARQRSCLCSTRCLKEPSKWRYPTRDADEKSKRTWLIPPFLIRATN